MGTHFTYRAGSKLALKLIFNTPSNDYMDFSLSAGFKFRIHNQDDVPSIFPNGIMGSAGQHYAFAVTKVFLGLILIFDF